MAAARKFGVFGEEEVLVQARMMPRVVVEGMRTMAFCRDEEFVRNIREASVVISHGGSTLLSVVRAGKTPVAMPRRADLGEIVNDHQVAFVAALARRGLASVAYEAEDLPRAIRRAREMGRPVALEGGGAVVVADAVRAAASIRRRGSEDSRTERISR
ncbi:MAG TPA: glycosyltransferase [Thermoanaerobaculia bacterium]|nr:glycosyltransferase [Thermoanaerobaculia bacterium]